MKWKLSVICLTLSALACGMPVTAAMIYPSVGSAPVPVNMDTVINTPMSTGVNMVVIADKLKIRTSPGGEVVQFAYLLRGDIVTVYERQTKNGYQWCRTGLHWVGCEWLEVE